MQFEEAMLIGPRERPPFRGIQYRLETETALRDQSLDSFQKFLQEIDSFHDYTIETVRRITASTGQLRSTVKILIIRKYMLYLVNLLY